MQNVSWWISVSCGLGIAEMVEPVYSASLAESPRKAWLGQAYPLLRVFLLQLPFLYAQLMSGSMLMPKLQPSM